MEIPIFPPVTNHIQGRHAASPKYTVRFINSGKIRQLTKRTLFEGFGFFSPDGSKIAYWFLRDGDFNNENENCRLLIG
jgi:hypothetical protein